MRVDYLVVGSGLTGATIARHLSDAGREVLVIERRAELGGNVHDYRHPSGIRVHTYGPHYFRTNSEEIWRYVRRFGSFYTYEPALKSLVDGSYENWPVAASYIRRTVGANWVPDFCGTPANFEEASLAKMPRLIYEKFVKGYTEKQWGVSATALSPSLARRFDVREDDEPRLMRHKYQAIPQDGYVALMRQMLNAIPVIFNHDYLRDRKAITPGKMLVYTGPIDEYYGYDLGRLQYRSQRREILHFPDVDSLQPCGQVNNPSNQNGPHIRTLEWKHMMAPECQRFIRGTVVTRETPYTPSNPDEYEYPFPDGTNARLYRAYASRAVKERNLLVCGRLGEYRYFDMDQAIGRAIQISRRILASNGGCVETVGQDNDVCDFRAQSS